MTTDQIEGIKSKYECPNIDHLFFADDYLFFIRGSVKKARQLRDVIDQYCRASGQNVNFSKSGMLFNSGTNEDYKREVMVVFRVQQVLNPGLYLRILMIRRIYRKNTLDYIKE